MKLANWQLKNIINFKNSEYRYAICFTNTSDLLMDEIKEKLKENNNITNIIIDMRNIDFTNYELVKNTIPNYLDSKSISKLLLESIIYGKITTDLLKLHPEKLSRYNEKFGNLFNSFNDNLNAKHFKDINVDGIIMWNILSGMIETLKNKNISVTINVFIPHDMNSKIQKSLNTLLNDRYPFYTRFYINSDELSCYYDSNGCLLEETHDYHERNLSEVRLNKNKIK